ncbi:uncharacterized protein [Heliangelus exortis]|uniref:uncharacterized protein isoform X2 n=1 Tax=Heliangelus exortis TaxID=472823 RepID=UPI003A8EB740
MAPQGNKDKQQRPGVGAGLKNMGNTCFLNAVLQCLTYTPSLANYLLSREHSQSCVQPGTCVMCRVQEHVRKVLHATGSAIVPVDVITALPEIGGRFRLGAQEDAHEFLRCTLDAMQRVCLCDGSLDTSCQQTVIHQIFGSFLRSRVWCSSCQVVSDAYEPFLDVLLDIKAAASLSEALDKFVKPELLDARSGFRCRHCGQMTAASKRLTIHWAPKVLTVGLKRFENVSGGKISKVVKYPKVLDLGPYTTAGEAQRYSLYAVLVHKGESCHSGHYFCYIKASDGLWYKMDDSSVTPCDVDTALQQEAYLLFYVRTEQRSPSQLHLAWVEDEAEEISLPVPDTMAQQLETDSWYSAGEKEEGQEMVEDAPEDLGEDQDLEWLRDVIVNLSPSVLMSLQDVSQAEKILRCVHRNVEHVRTEPSRFVLRSVLGLLSECCPEETVQTLLMISPSCDNAALAMWEMLLSLPSTSVTVLDRLLSVIQGWRAKCAVPSARQVLSRLSQRPRCQGILELLFPRLLMSLIYKVSLGTVILGQEPPQADEASPLGVAVEGVKALLDAAGFQGHVQNIQKEGGWDMMLDVDTLERGVSLLAREMRKSPAKQRYLLFQHVKEILDQRREWQLNFAMTFYTELLGCQGLGKDLSDVRLLRSYLSHGNQTVRLLALGGLVALSGDPQMAREMRDSSVLDRILMCLKDPSTNIRMGALQLFQTMMRLLKRKEASPVALLLVEKLPALFGDESGQVQELSLSLFGEMMKAVASRDRGEMKKTIRRVMVSLFLHMYTESRSMAEASGKGLLICAKFLGWRNLKRAVKKKKTWLIGETLVRTTPRCQGLGWTRDAPCAQGVGVPGGEGVGWAEGLLWHTGNALCQPHDMPLGTLQLKQDRSRVGDYVRFSLPYLRDSRASVRAEAMRFMGTAAQLLGRNPPKETLEVLWNVVKPFDKDPDASVRSQAGETLHILQTVTELQRQRWSLRRLCFWR